MKKELSEIVKSIFSSEKFPTRAFVIYTLLVLLLSILSMPINEKVTAIMMQDMQLDPVQKEMAMNMSSKMGPIMMVFSVVGSLVGILACSLFVYLTSKIIHAEISFNHCSLLCLAVFIILLVNDYIDVVVNLILGIDNIHSIKDTCCTSIGYVFNLSDNTYFSKILLIINPFTFIAFAFFSYCLNLLFKVKASTAVYTSLALFCIYILFQASLLNI